MLLQVFRSPDIKVTSCFIIKHSCMYCLLFDDAKGYLFAFRLIPPNYQSQMRNEETGKDEMCFRAGMKSQETRIWGTYLCCAVRIPFLYMQVVLIKIITTIFVNIHWVQLRTGHRVPTPVSMMHN